MYNFLRQGSKLNNIDLKRGFWEDITLQPVIFQLWKYMILFIILIVLRKNDLCHLNDLEMEQFIVRSCL